MALGRPNAPNLSKCMARNGVIWKNPTTCETQNEMVSSGQEPRNRMTKSVRLHLWSYPQLFFSKEKITILIPNSPQSGVCWFVWETFDLNARLRKSVKLAPISMKTENYSRLYQNNYQIWIDNQKTQKMAWNSDSTQTISLFDHIKTKTYEN